MQIGQSFVSHTLQTIRNRVKGATPGTTRVVEENLTPANTTERPHFRGEGAVLPARAIFNEIYRRSHTDPANIITEEQRATLTKIEREIQKARHELKVTLHGGDLASWRKAAKNRLHKGRGTAADVALDAANFQALKKAVKRQLSAACQSAQPTLAEVAQAVEKLARRTLPEIEAEAARLGIAPFEVPLVRSVALACWAPSVIAVRRENIPSVFLRGLGIKL